MHTILGVDVSKDSLDMMLLLPGGVVHGRTALNQEIMIEEALDWAKKIAKRKTVMVAMEATSKYHYRLCEVLRNRKIAYKVFNPRQVRDLAKGLGYLRKTDKVDALVIARCALAVEPEPTEPRSEVHEQLREVSREIQFLTKEAANLAKRARVEVGSKALQESQKRLIRQLKEEIKVLSAHWLELLKEEPLVLENYNNALSVEGVGKVTARVVVSELPADLSQYTTKQIASYAGVVPHENQSGQTRKRSSVGRTGNGFIRSALYMPSTRLAFFSSPWIVRRAKLEESGKAHKQVIMALMHRLMRHIAAVLIRRSPWVPA